MNQIRIWARDGVSDAWIAHQLGTTPETITAFRREHAIVRGGGAPVVEPVTPELVAAQSLADEPTPRQADAPASPEPAADEPPPPARSRRRTRAKAPEAATHAAPPEAADDDGRAEVAADAAPAEPKPRRRRSARAGADAPAATVESEPGADEGRGDARDAADAPAADAPRSRTRRGRRRRGTSRPLTGTLSGGIHLLLPAALAQDPVFVEHWGNDGQAVEIELSAETIVLRRPAP